MPRRLPKPAERIFLEDVLLGSWTPSEVVGFDPSSGPSSDAHLATGSSLADVGEAYPTLTVQRSNETAPGETTYDAIGDSGPSQNRTGQLLATARAEAGEYTGDSAQYSAVDAGALVDMLIAEVEDVCLDNHLGGSTDFTYLGSQRGADAPDDFDASPPVYIEQCTIAYSWIRS